MDLDDFELAAFDLLEGGDKRTAAQGRVPEEGLDDLESAAWAGLDLHKRIAFFLVAMFWAAVLFCVLATESKDCRNYIIISIIIITRGTA